MPMQGPVLKPPAPSPWVVVTVLALHLLLLWGLHEATHKPTPPAPRLTPAMSLKRVTEARVIPAAAPRPTDPAHTSPAAVPRRPRDARARMAPSPSPTVDPQPGSVDPSPLPAGIAAQARQPEAEADQPVAATPPASSPLLDSLASRRAIRELARQQPITEQAALASATPLPAPGARLGERIREAGKGDCAKGDYFGAGMGLLSLPFLMAAAVRDDCAQ